MFSLACHNHAGNTCKAELLKKSGIVADDGWVVHSINDNFNTIEYICIKMLCICRNTSSKSRAHDSPYLLRVSPSSLKY